MPHKMTYIALHIEHLRYPELDSVLMSQQAVRLAQPVGIVQGKLILETPIIGTNDEYLYPKTGPLGHFEAL